MWTRSETLEERLKAIESYSWPRLIPLGNQVFGLYFDCMKMFPACQIVRDADAAGELGPETPLLETSSGTFGLGLATVCANSGHTVHLVSDTSLEANMRTRLTALGAKLHLLPIVEGEHPQLSRLKYLEELAQQFDNAYLPRQYSNPSNVRAYHKIAEWLTEQLGEVGSLVAPVGSGGSISGLGGALKSHSGETFVIAVDSVRSVLFGQADGARQLRGVGSSFSNSNLLYEVVDRVHWVPFELARAGARLALSRRGLFLGPTAGAALAVAEWESRAGVRKPLIVMMPDSGHRYWQTVYDEPALSSDEGEMDRAPLMRSQPTLHGERWEYMDWDGKSPAYTQIGA